MLVFRFDWLSDVVYDDECAGCATRHCPPAPYNAFEFRCLNPIAERLHLPDRRVERPKRSAYVGYVMTVANVSYRVHG